MRPLSFFLVAALGASLTACAIHTSNDATNPPAPPPTSSTLATSDMWPSMSAQCDGQTLRVYAAVLKGSDFVLLDTGDFFTANIGGDDVVLTREPYTDGKIHYTATFTPPATATDVVIALHRSAGRVAALGSKTVLPAPFELTSPAPESVKLGDVISLAISPPPVLAAKDDRMTVALYGDCLADHDPYPVTFDADGHASFDTAQVALKPGSTQGCGIGVQVRRETTGPSDPAFASADGNPVAGLQARGYATSLLK